MKENLPVSLQKLIHKVEENFAEDPAMVELFINCFSNTLDTTVKKMEDGTTHVITGDIPAMWLRDSVAQVRPYLVAAAEDQEISDLLAGLSRRQFFFVNHDPYANAFNQEENGNCWDHDETEMSDWLWERKYEIDSLCYPVQFAYLLWKNTGRTDHFDDNFVKGLHTILNVWKTEQYHEEKSPYSFQRKGFSGKMRQNIRQRRTLSARRKFTAMPMQFRSVIPRDLRARLLWARRLQTSFWISGASRQALS